MIDQPDIVKKAWKLIEALAEPCEHRDDEDHGWRRCRRCLATEELETKTGRQLVGIIKGEGATIGVLREQVAALTAQLEKAESIALLMAADRDRAVMRQAELEHRAERAEAENTTLRAALELIESVYRKNCVAEGEPSSVLEAVQAALLRRTP